MEYASTRTVESEVCPGVQFTLNRMSFGRRMELMKRVREAARTIEFHRAGETTEDKLDIALAGAEVDRLYLTWGLREVCGLEIDGIAADAAALISAGPEDLCREVIAEVKRECGLTEDERKN